MFLLGTNSNTPESVGQFQKACLKGPYEDGRRYRQVQALPPALPSTCCVTLSSCVSISLSCPHLKHQTLEAVMFWEGPRVGFTGTDICGGGLGATANAGWTQPRNPFCGLFTLKA